MKNNHMNKVESSFTIKDDIIIGNESPELLRKHSLPRCIFEIFEKYPSTIGQIDSQTDEALTFAEMKDRSVRCAIWLRKQNLNKNDVVCISTYNQMNDFVPLLASFYTGVICNPWYYELTLFEAKRFFLQVKPKIMFACKDTIKILTKAAAETGIFCKFISFESSGEYTSLAEILALQSQEDVDNFFYSEPKNASTEAGIIFFSSGTTGVPKGTILSSDIFVNPHANLCDEKKIHYWIMNIFWSAGVHFLINCILNNSTRIVVKDFDPEEACKIIIKYKVTKLSLSPAKLTSMCSANVFDRYELPHLEKVSFGGSKIVTTVLDKLRKALPHVFVSQIYSLTEFGGIGCHQTEKCKRINSAGFVNDHVKLKIIDAEKGHTLGPNEEGEICFKTHNMMIGYLDNPEATEEMIDNDGWLHTGDLGFYDENGEVTIVNRLKELILTRNHRIAPSIIVEMITNHPGVSKAAVVPVPHEVDGERPMAFVVKVPGSNVTAEELQEIPTSYNQNHRITGGVVFLDKLPLTSVEKVATKKLKEMAIEYVKSNGDTSIKSI